MNAICLIIPPYIFHIWVVIYIHSLGCLRTYIFKSQNPSFKQTLRQWLNIWNRYGRFWGDLYQYCIFYENVGEEAGAQLVNRPHHGSLYPLPSDPWWGAIVSENTALQHDGPCIGMYVQPLVFCNVRTPANPSEPGLLGLPWTPGSQALLFSWRSLCFR